MIKFTINHNMVWVIKKNKTKFLKISYVAQLTA
jgi:hypothetical protein